MAELFYMSLWWLVIMKLLLIIANFNLKFKEEQLLQEPLYVLPHLTFITIL